MSKRSRHSLNCITIFFIYFCELIINTKRVYNVIPKRMMVTYYNSNINAFLYQRNVNYNFSCGKCSNFKLFVELFRLHIYVNLSHPKIFWLTTFEFQRFHQENKFPIVKVRHNLCMGILMLVIVTYFVRIIYLHYLVDTVNYQIIV